MIEFHEVSGVRLAWIVGDLDISNVDEMKFALGEAAAGKEKLVLSLEECTFVDSTALSALIATHQRLPEGLGVVLPRGGKLERVFSTLGLMKVFQVFNSVDAAIAWYKSKPASEGNDVPRLRGR